MTIKYDVMLTESTGDIPRYPTLGNGVEKVAQSATIACRLHLGEAIFDKTKGLPYFDWSQMKPFRLAEVSDYVKTEISRLDGVIRVSEWSHVFDKRTRKATITGTVVVQGGSEFRVSVLPSGNSRGNSNPLVYFTINGLPKIYSQGIL